MIRRKIMWFTELSVVENPGPHELTRFNKSAIVGVALGSAEFGVIVDFDFTL